MFHDEFIRDFATLGLHLRGWADGTVSDAVLTAAAEEARRENPFFTPYMQRHAVRALADAFLEEKQLTRWLRRYFPAGAALPEPERFRPSRADGSVATVGIIMAGNIPLVGFHDLLCVLACGRKAVVKMSSKDNRLLPAVLAALGRIRAHWCGQVEFAERVPLTVDALIATGSGETAEKVKRAYAGVPMLVRGRRFSYAVLTGKETPEQLRALGEDVFLYFGLGCRSVSYLLLPEGYDPAVLTEGFAPMRTLVSEDCYRNIYKRNRSMLMLEGEPFADGGFFILRQTPEVFVPAGVLGYRTYRSAGDILEFGRKNSARIQKKYCTFGQAQTPAVDEYADGTDTVEFILKH